MALVKKYQNAAGPLPEGKFTMNGKSLIGNMALERLAAAYKNKNDAPKDMYSIANQAIKDRNEVVYDPINNTIQIKNNLGEDITSNYIDKRITASANDSEFKKNFGATFNTRNHRFKLSGLPLANVDMDTRQELRRGSGWFDLNDKNYDTNSLLNRDKEDIIKSLLLYASDESNVDDKYKYSNWSDNDRTQLRNLGNELRESGTDAFYTSFINRLHSGNLSDGDINLLKLMGFSKPEEKPIIVTPPVDGGSAGYKEGDEEGSEDSNPSIPEEEKEGVVKGTDGRFYLKGDAYKDSIWYLGGFDNFIGTPYENGFSINGNIYSLDEVLNNREFDPYVAKFLNAGKTATDWNSWYDAANTSGVRFLDDRLWAKAHGVENTDSYYGGYQNYNSDLFSPTYDDYFRSIGFSGGGVKDITPWVKDSKGYKILTYVSPKEKNAAGVMTPLYAAYLGDGKYSAPIGSLDDLLNIYHLELDPYGKYRQTVLPLNHWNNGLAEYARFKTADGTQENTILRDKNGISYLKYGNTYREIPRENFKRVYDLLERGEDITNKEIVKLTRGGRKYQTGGELVSSSTINGSTLGKYEEPKEPQKSDVSKPHNLDGSDGGLTTPEYLQIAGALADLGGVVTSFAGPVGGVIGMGTGITGNLLRFTGDLTQHNKSVWGSIKDLAINSAFDIASLPASVIPGLDNAIKASKFVRVVKGIGTPILKWMGTMGLGSSLINTASKIINGEKYTSEDLVNLAQGLAGGIVAGKQWSKQIGDAKLASKLSTKAANEANANLRESFATRVGDKELTLNKEEISNMVEEAKGNKARVIEKLIAKARQNNIELTNEQAENALSDFNIYNKKQSLVKKLFKSKKVEFEEPTTQDGRSSTYYFFNNLNRNRALGNLKGNTKQKNLIVTITKEDYNNALFRDGKPVRTKDYTWEGALRRIGAQNPNALSFSLRDETTLFPLPGQFGRRANIRRVTGNSYTTPETKVEITPLGLPVYTPRPTPTVGTNLPSGETINQGYTPILQITRGTDAPLNILPSSGTVIYGSQNLGRDNATLRKFNSPVFWNKLNAQERMKKPYGKFKLRLPDIESTSPIQVSMGKGRFNIGAYNKYIKQAPAIAKFEDLKNNIVGNNTSTNTLKKLEELGDNKEFKELVNKNPELAKEFANYMRTKFTSAAYKNKPSAQKDAYFNKRLKEMKVKYDWRFKKGGQLPKYQIGGLLGKAIKANISPVLDLSSALIQNRDISKSYDYLREQNAELKKRQFIAPQIQLPIYNASSIEQKYNNAKNPLLNTKFNYSDPAFNLAGRLSVAEQLSNLEAQKGTELTDYTSRYNESRLNALNQIAQMNANLANEKSNYLTTLNANDKKLQTAELNEKWQNIWNTYSQQVRQDLRDKHDEVNSYIFNKELSELKTDQDLERKNLLSDLYEQYNKSKYSGTFEDWLTKNPNAYLEYRQILNSDGWRELLRKQNKDYTNTLIKNVYAKKGAKLMEFPKNNKSTKEGVNGINESLIQTLLKLKK